MKGRARVALRPITPDPRLFKRAIASVSVSIMFPQRYEATNKADRASPRSQFNELAKLFVTLVIPRVSRVIVKIFNIAGDETRSVYAIRCRLVSLRPKGVNSHSDPLEFTGRVRGPNFPHKANRKSLGPTPFRSGYFVPCDPTGDAVPGFRSTPWITAGSRRAQRETPAINAAGNIKNVISARGNCADANTARSALNTPDFSLSSRELLIAPFPRCNL